MYSSISGDEDVEWTEYISNCNEMLNNAEIETESEPESDYDEVVSTLQTLPQS